MFARLVLLFTLVPALEIYLLIKVGAGIGALNTILLIIATGVVGAHYARLQGFYVLRRLEASLAEGRLPAAEILDGAMLLVGGALLITPGFLTDLAGFSLVFPPTREIWRRHLVDWLRRRLERGEIVIVRRRDPWDGSS
ncbi:MAG: FxsA family protein [Candidatus Dadabacteria bacterium]|nr:MAG: FxsA family protein [Candidatus Dadabacteria bacterium]